MRRNLLCLLILFFLTVSRIMNEEQRIHVCKTGLNQIQVMLRSSPQDWRNYVRLAHSVISHLDGTTFMIQHSRTMEHVWVITVLQRIAHVDADNGGMPDVASWCSRQWLAIYQRDPSNVAALRGIGQSWLSRAQPLLARIHQTSSASSSSGGSSQRSRKSRSASEEERAAAATSDAERKAGTQDYVEARGLLQPATEYFERAVSAATTQRAPSGNLLAAAAEAHMSLGNVSSPRVNERHFRRAVELLRSAVDVPGYTLSPHLQQYLEDYGRLLD